jgi:hypothetical protein
MPRVRSTARRVIYVLCIVCALPSLRYHACGSFVRATSPTMSSYPRSSEAEQINSDTALVDFRDVSERVIAKVFGSYCTALRISDPSL